jgi:hypothetical protein
MSDIIESTYAHYLVFGGSILGLVWGGVNVLQVNKVELDAANIKVAETNKDEEVDEDLPSTPEACMEQMLHIN